MNAVRERVAAEMLAMMGEQPPPTVEQHELNSSGQLRRAPKLVAVGAHDLLRADFPDRETLLEPWLQSQALTMIYAWRGVGKTYMAMLIAYALASGGRCLQWHAPKAVPVLYLDGEMPGAALRDRLAAIVAGADVEPPEGYLRFVTPDLQPDGIMPDLSTYEGQKAIDAVLGDSRVIVVDNLSCLARTGKENEGDSWQPVAEWALRMRATGRTVIFIHHSGKGGQQRGTSKREDLLDVVMLLKRPADYSPVQGARFPELVSQGAHAAFNELHDRIPNEHLARALVACWFTVTAELLDTLRERCPFVPQPGATIPAFIEGLRKIERK